jgi:ribosome-associated translation inhibitor RaiA
MKKPLVLCLRHLDDENHERLEELVNDRAARLERLAAGIVGCHVTVDRPQYAAQSRSPYRVVVLLTLPPKHQLVVSYQPMDLHGTIGEVVSGAFDAMERKLRAMAELRRGDVKQHTRLAPEWHERRTARAAAR